MSDDKTYRVKALGAIVNAEGGFAQLLQRGAVLPSNVDKVQLQHLLDNDLVEEGEPLGGLEPIWTGDLQSKVTHRTDAEVKAEVDDVDGDGPIPPKSADKATWVAYAVSQGADQAEAEAGTKEDLIAAYGSA